MGQMGVSRNGQSGNETKYKRGQKENEANRSAIKWDKMGIQWNETKYKMGRNGKGTKLDTGQNYTGTNMSTIKWDKKETE